MVTFCHSNCDLAEATKASQRSADRRSVAGYEKEVKGRRGSMENPQANEKENWINMQSIFDGGDNPHKRIGSGSTEVVKKLSFQLGCQSQDDDIQTTKNVSTEPVQHRQNKLSLTSTTTAVAVAIDVNETLSQTERSEINSDIVHVTPLLRHQYSRNHLVLNSPAEKEDVERENELIYDSLRTRRRYQLWRGNNVFLCYGRLMLGVHIGHLTLSISLITGEINF